MSFDYPRSDQSIVVGQDFYRIRAPISTLFNGTKQTTPQNFSIGDLAPVDSPVSAIAVGPDSDFFRYEITYPDKLAPGGVNSALLTPVNPLVIPTTGVNLAAPYQGTPINQLIFGRILDWLPIEGQLTLPLIDLIIYTKTAPGFYPMQRNPKRLTAAVQLFVAPQASSVRIPVSGRQEVSVRFRQSVPAATISWEIRGEKLFGYQGGIPELVSYELLASTVVGAATPQPFADGLFTYSAPVHGYYDSLNVVVTSDTAHDPSSSDLAFTQALLDTELRD